MIFAVTLTVSEDGGTLICIQIRFAGHTDTKPRGEVRAPSEIIPKT